MPFVKVYLHTVWSTKYREPFLENINLRAAMWEHIRSNARKNNIFIDTINGYAEHCHCLISLGNEQTISKSMQLIKGESAFWFNKQKLIKDKLQWQDEYFAISVSESVLERTRNYIRNQEEHHKKKSFQQEYDDFLKTYNFDTNRNLFLP